MNPFEEVRERAPLSEVLDLYGYTPDRSGKICCPFHGEKTPSFGIDKKRNRFHCFGCGWDGSAIDFVMQMDNKSAFEAARDLNDTFGLGAEFEEDFAQYARERAKDEHAREEWEEYRTEISFGLAQSFDQKARDFADEDLRKDAERKAASIRMILENEILYGWEYNAEDPEGTVLRMRDAVAAIVGTDRTDAIRRKYHPEEFPDESTGANDTGPENLDAIPDEAAWSEEPPEPPVFLFFPYIPAGKLTALSSRGGIGKGHFACLLAARASRGFNFRDIESNPYPEEFHLIKGATHTLYITRGEDSTSDIQTRYTNSGGVRGYLHIINEGSNKGSFNINKLKVNTEEGYKLLYGLVKKYNAKIIIFDTMDKFLDADSNKQGEVQDGLTNLQSFAGEMGIAILCVLHDRKGGSGGNMADKVAGSREWTDVPRSVLQMDFDPEDESAENNRKSTSRRVVLHTKANGEYGKTLRFCISGTVGNSGARFPLSEDECSIFAEVSPDDYELADLRKTTVRAIIKEKRLRSLTAEARMHALKEAIQAEADELRETNRRRVKYSYDQFEARHGGKGVWGGEPQRLKAVQLVSPNMAENGVSIEFQEIKPGEKTGKAIRGTDGKAGFAICIT